MKIVKVKDLPKEMLKTKNRRIMWKNTKKVLKKLQKVFKVSNVYICGSFTTKKKWPNDVDVIVLFKVKDIDPKEKWSVDVEFVSNPKQTFVILNGINRYMKKRYPKNNSIIYELKI